MEETEPLTVLTLVSDNDNSFLTASGECVPNKAGVFLELVPIEDPFDKL